MVLKVLTLGPMALIVSTANTNLQAYRPVDVGRTLGLGALPGPRGLEISTYLQACGL